MRRARHPRPPAQPTPARARYKHASYTDQYSQPERVPFQRPEGDEFRDPPDIRYPNQWEGKRFSSFETNLSGRARATSGVGARGARSSLSAERLGPQT